MSYYSDSGSSESEQSYYKNIDILANNDIAIDSKGDYNEGNVYSQLKTLVEDKQVENKNETMILHNLQLENQQLKDKFDEMNEMIAVYKKQYEEYGYDLKDQPVYGLITKNKGPKATTNRTYSKKDEDDDSNEIVN